MVSFSCEACGDVLTKKKLDPHRNRCSGATFTCIDCMVHFPGTHYRSHTSCMTEDQKYQGALYKESNKKAKTHNKRTASGMAQPAYVEDVDEWRDYQGPTDDERSPAELLPEAPTPPAAAADDNEVNVFDYMVSTGQTPNASDMNLAIAQDGKESQSLVRYEGNADEILDPISYLEEEQYIEYGSGPYDTPAASKERRRKDGDPKTDKKRKRLHVDTRDSIMTDAPPVLSSGLTGGLNRLMRPQLPPSPNESGADATPASPLKKSKSKHTKGGQVSNSIFGMIAGSSKSKTKAKKPKTKKSSSKSPKMIEYRPGSKDGKEKDSQAGELILFQPDAHALFSYVNKGSDSEKGCSMNKALKRFHRDRKASGEKLSKASAEKELWRSIRLRKNDAGEIVLIAA